MGAIYNEIEPYACAWLENLIAAGHIAPGRVDERSIVELRATDLVGVVQFHAFAGLGGWSHALRLAGWPDDRPVWTGSCPCQPFSVAGRGLGTADERHLWPVWFELIRECRPAIVFGEQVAGGAGRAWLDAVSADLEGAGYAVGAAALPACSVGAPHKRERLLFVAHADRAGPAGWSIDGGSGERGRSSAERGGGRGDGMADTEGSGLHEQRGVAGIEDRARLLSVLQPPDGGRMGDADANAGRRERGRLPRAEAGGQRLGRPHDGPVGVGPRDAGIDVGAVGGFWSGADWIRCNDPIRGEVWRPVEPGLEPLVTGAAARVGRLRAYGNAIVAPLIAEFIRASIEAIGDVATIARGEGDAVAIARAALGAP